MEKYAYSLCIKGTPEQLDVIHKRLLKQNEEENADRHLIYGGYDELWVNTEGMGASHPSIIHLSVGQSEYMNILLNMRKDGLLQVGELVKRINVYTSYYDRSLQTDEMGVVREVRGNNVYIREKDYNWGHDRASLTRPTLAEIQKWCNIKSNNVQEAQYYIDTAGEGPLEKSVDKYEIF